MDINRSTFVRAVGVSNVVQISCGYRHVMALRADGRIFGTGVNDMYALGVTGVGFVVSSYVQAVGISQAVMVAAGKSSSMALQSDGNVYVTGYPDYGQLGLGALFVKATFVATTGLSMIRAVALSGNTAIALRSDGIVLASGDNSYGAVGDNTTANRSTFVAAVGISNAIAIAIAAGKVASYALRSDGFVYSYGFNFGGQLGDGTDANRSTYVRALGISNVVAIGPATALRSDGVLFATGLNGGALGDGSTTYRSSYAAAFFLD
jgi:alpha-tubulin suppressor-like RCC1 family protein